MAARRLFRSKLLGLIVLVVIVVGAGLAITNLLTHPDSRLEPEPTQPDQQSRPRQPDSLPRKQIPEDGTKGGTGDAAEVSDESVKHDYLRLSSFPRDASHMDFYIALPAGLASFESSNRVVAGNRMGLFRGLGEGPAKISIKPPVPEQLPFELEHSEVDGLVYSGHATRHIEGNSRYWDVEIPAATVTIVVESTEAVGTADVGFNGVRPDGYAPSNWSDIELPLHADSVYVVALVPWKYEVEAWARSGSIDEPGPPADRPSELITYFDFEPDTIDLRAGVGARVSLRVRRADAWRPVNTFGRSIRTVYATDGGERYNGPVIAYPDDYEPDQDVGMGLNEITPARGEDYDPTEWSVLDNWKYDASGGLWFREPELLEEPAIAVIEFDDGGVSVIRRTEPLGLSVRELVVTGTPDDGERVEFAGDAPANTRIVDVAVHCEIRLPQSDSDSVYCYTTRKIVLLDGITTVSIPYNGELRVDDIELPRGSTLEVVTPEAPDRDGGGSDYWGSVLRGGDRMTIKLAERSE